MSAQKRRASSVSSSFSPLLPANVAHISRPDWQLPNSMTAPELIVFCKWQNGTWNTFSPNSLSIRLDNPVRVPSLLWLEECLHRLGLCSFSLHSCPVSCECLTKNSKERECGGTGCSLAGEGFSSKGKKHNVHACVRTCVSKFSRLYHHVWHEYISNLTIFGAMVLMLLNASSCIWKMHFFLSCGILQAEMFVVLLLVDVVERAWEPPIHHNWQNLAANTTARGSHTQGDRSWEITLLAPWKFDSCMSMLIKTWHTPFGCHCSVLERIPHSYRSHGSERKEGRKKKRRI